MGQNQCCFALLYEFEARGIFELMLVVKQKKKLNDIVLKGTRRLKRAGKGKMNKGHHKKLVDTNFFSSPLSINVKFMLH